MNLKHLRRILGGVMLGCMLNVGGAVAAPPPASAAAADLSAATVDVGYGRYHGRRYGSRYRHGGYRHGLRRFYRYLNPYQRYRQGYQRHRYSRPYRYRRGGY